MSGRGGVHPRTQAIVTALGIPKQGIRPSTPLNILIPEQNRAQLWKSIRSASLLIMPELETSWVVYGDRYPSGASTVGDLAEKVMVLNHRQLATEINGWNANDVWKALCVLIVDELRVRPDQLTREANFVRDLKID